MMNSQKPTLHLVAGVDEDIQRAHALLLARADHYRGLRGISLDAAILVLHEDFEAGDLDLALAAAFDAYKRWRAVLLGNPGTSDKLTAAELAVWLKTKQFGDHRPGQKIKLHGQERTAAFTGLMSLVDELCAQGLSPSRAIGKLINEAMESEPGAPNEVRKMFSTAMGRRGSEVVGVPRALGLPSSMTVYKWHRAHREGGVVDRQQGRPKRERKWVSRSARWVAAARKLIAADPALSPIRIHSKLLAEWNALWGKPIGRKLFVAAMQDDFKSI